mgnify:CR=1 FL=1
MVVQSFLFRPFALGARLPRATAQGRKHTIPQAAWVALLNQAGGRVKGVLRGNKDGHA